MVSDQQVKRIWWCWLQGLEQAPALPRACLHSLQKYYPDYEITVVTADNMQEYADIPEFILQKWHDGRIPVAQFSDILRTLLLVKHGGVWIDSTVLATAHTPAEPGGVFREPLFFYSTFMHADVSMAGSSWLISASCGHPVLELMREFLFAYWQQYDYLIHYYIFHFFFHMALERYSELWQAVPTYSNIPPHVLQFELFTPYNANRLRQIKRMSSFHKLTRHRNENTEGDITGTFYDYIVNHTDQVLAE